ncbi:keratin-associated protein 5-7-like [Hemicordylus capensis]|uniref:keratin-associated protein 5-7-like n=1 Tax=Hemicordylus capensis TaxID=884348 RepID=UPI00230346CB|nr:keratin-associated protein 5-7-like [Hemicordylus capensis]
MACCGGGSCGGSGGYGGYGGYGGHGSGAGAGSGGVLVDTGRTSDVHVQPGGCSLTVPGPRLVCHCDTRVSCHCVCAEECCAAACCGSGGYSGYGGGRGGAGNYGPGMRVDMRYPSYDVILPGAFLCSTAHCGHVDCCESCCDPCCGPC